MDNALCHILQIETYAYKPLQIIKQDQQWLTEEETVEEIPSTESVDKV